MIPDTFRAKSFYHTRNDVFERVEMTFELNEYR